MEVIRDIDKWDFRGESIVTIGTFDGVHYGHKRILNRLKEIKTDINQKTIVFTFEPHPRKVLFPEQTDLQLLTSLTEKIALFEKAGIDICVMFPFTSAFAKIEPITFIKDILVQKLKLKKLVIGYDHKFGKDRKGDISTFRELAEELNYEVEEITAQEINDNNVSSTKIRRALFDGDVLTAALYLGHNYTLIGKVIKGKMLGRTIGYPTANLLISDKDKLIPKNGVYFVKTEIDNCFNFGMMNIGLNPTTDSDNKLKLEVNIFNFDKDIYEKDIKIEFLQRIREEEKFDSIEALKNKIKSDENKCKELIKNTEL